MDFNLPKLPYAFNALAPTISEASLKTHYLGHHQKYLETAKRLLHDNPLAKQPVEYIINHASGAVFNNVAQAYNHEFFWNSLSPHASTPSKSLMDAISKAFSDMDGLKNVFITRALNIFGSGWCWLVKNAMDEVRVISTANANTPFSGKNKAYEEKPLLVVDTWEHAYYLDYGRDKTKYLNQIWNLLNWDFASKQFQQA